MFNNSGDKRQDGAFAFGGGLCRVARHTKNLMCINLVSQDSKSRRLSEGETGVYYPKAIARTRNTMSPEITAARTPSGKVFNVPLVSDATVDGVAAENTIGSGSPEFMNA